MKRITLVRHGHAETHDASIGDFDRVLTGRGHAEAVDAGKRIDEQGSAPDLIVSSPAPRARQTANAIARELGLAEACIRCDESLYLALPGTLLAAVARTAPDIDHLVLVGHNPGISEFARLLAQNSDLEELVTGASCSMRLSTENWKVTFASGVDARCGAPPRVFPA